MCSFADTRGGKLLFQGQVRQACGVARPNAAGGAEANWGRIREMKDYGRFHREPKLTQVVLFDAVGSSRQVVAVRGSDRRGGGARRPCQERPCPASMQIASIHHKLRFRPHNPCWRVVLAVSLLVMTTNAGEVSNSRRIFWGDVHGHTAHSDGKGTLDEYFTYARDTATLDFVIVTDHDFGNGIPSWSMPGPIPGQGDPDRRSISVPRKC